MRKNQGVYSQLQAQLSRWPPEQVKLNYERIDVPREEAAPLPIESSGVIAQTIHNRRRSAMIKRS